LALVAFNLYAVVRAALQVAHPETDIQEEVSEYCIASDIRAIYSGMVIAVDYQDWSIFQKATIAQMAVLRVDLARTCNLAKLKKKKRGVKKPKVNVKLDKKYLMCLRSSCFPVIRKKHLERAGVNSPPLAAYNGS